jgi:hypothetical protein
MTVRMTGGHSSQQFRHVSNGIDDMDLLSIEEISEELRIQRQQADSSNTRKFGFMKFIHQKNNGIPRFIMFEGEEEQYGTEDTSEIEGPHIGMVIQVRLEEEDDEKDRLRFRQRSMSLCWRRHFG